MYIGIDVHKNSCYIAALNEAGELLEEKQIKTENIEEWIQTLNKNCKIAMETSTASKPIYHIMKRKRT